MALKILKVLGNFPVRHFGSGTAVFQVLLVEVDDREIVVVDVVVVDVVVV